MKLALIGYGQMGQALAGAWVNGSALAELHVVDPHLTAKIELPEKAQGYTQIEDLTSICDVIMLAVKPQQMADVLADLKPIIKPDSLVITIAAGLPLAFYQQAISPAPPLVRVMPNTPAQVRQGMSVGVATPTVNAAQRLQVEKLFQAAGAFAWLDDEKLFDVVTAISGSGPAYYFLFTEFLAQWGVEHGLTAELANQLARQTLIGSGALIAAKTDQSPIELRAAVTSKGGVTAAALDIFQDNDVLAKLVANALAANVARSLEMAAT